MTIAIDAANGAAYVTTPLAVEKLGAQIELMAATPNGLNINEKCGSTHPQGLCELVRKTANDLLECKNFGVTSLTEVREKLTTLNIKLRGE